MRRVIVNFHGIGRPQRPLEPGEAPYWLLEPQFADALSRIAAARTEPGLDVSITFDDSNASDFEIAAPQLERFGLTATFFVLTGRLTSPGSLSAAQVRALHAGGHTIGCHGIHHVDWRNCDDAMLTCEVDDAKARLEDIIGAAVTDAAVPFGHYNARVLRALWNSGYAHVFTSDGGTALPRAWLQPRTSLRFDTTTDALDALIRGHDSVLHRARRTASMAWKRVA